MRSLFQILLKTGHLLRIFTVFLACEYFFCIYLYKIDFAPTTRIISRQKVPCLLHNTSDKVRRGSSRTVGKHVHFQISRWFFFGFTVGIIATVAILLVGTIGTLQFMAEKANNSAIFANAPVQANGNNEVQLYFPLERFLVWRSTPVIQLGMIHDEVHAQVTSEILPQIHFRVSVDIFGKPSITDGYFSLSHVYGYVDHFPVPQSILLGAIATDGEKYGIHVNAVTDSLFIEKNFGSYRLLGYDALSRDLVISIPVSAVEHAARGQSIL